MKRNTFEILQAQALPNFDMKVEVQNSENLQFDWSQQLPLSDRLNILRTFVERVHGKKEVVFQKYVGRNTTLPRVVIIEPIQLVAKLETYYQNIESYFRASDIPINQYMRKDMDQGRIRTSPLYEKYALAHGDKIRIIEVPINAPMLFQDLRRHPGKVWNVNANYCINYADFKNLCLLEYCSMVSLLFTEKHILKQLDERKTAISALGNEIHTVGQKGDDFSVPGFYIKNSIIFCGASRQHYPVSKKVDRYNACFEM
jgi:hypothetical protein